MLPSPVFACYLLHDFVLVSEIHVARPTQLPYVTVEPEA